MQNRWLKIKISDDSEKIFKTENTSQLLSIEVKNEIEKSLNDKLYHYQEIENYLIMNLIKIDSMILSFKDKTNNMIINIVEEKDMLNLINFINNYDEVILSIKISYGLHFANMNNIIINYIYKKLK